MGVVATSPHNNDELSDISGPLLLTPTIATGSLTSEDVATVGAHGTSVVATSPHNSDGLSDISGSLLLASIVAMSALISDAHCYCGDT
jgi:hypothetical protein